MVTVAKSSPPQPKYVLTLSGAVVLTSGTHRSDNATLAAMLMHVVNRSGESHILNDDFLCYTFMGDGASVVQLAAVHANGDSLKCIAHTVSRAVKTVLSDGTLKASPIVAKLLDAIRSIFRFVANHADARQSIDEAQRDILGCADDQLLVVSTPKDIRWHVHQWAVAQFAKLCPVLFGFCEHLERTICDTRRPMPKIVYC